GMWMGMTSQSTNMATLRTIAFVQVIPWFVITFVSAFMVFFFLRRIMGSSSFSMSRQMLTSSALPAFLYIVKDIVLGVVAKRTLYSSFRRLAVGETAPLDVPPVPRI